MSLADHHYQNKISASQKQNNDNFLMNKIASAKRKSDSESFIKPVQEIRDVQQSNGRN